MIQTALKLTQLIMDNTIGNLLDTTVFYNRHALLMTGFTTVLGQPLLRQAIERPDKQLIQRG